MKVTLTYGSGRTEEWIISGAAQNLAGGFSATIHGAHGDRYDVEVNPTDLLRMCIKSRGLKHRTTKAGPVTVRKMK